MATDRPNAFEESTNVRPLPANTIPLRTEGGPTTLVAGPALIFVSDQEKKIYRLDGDHEALARDLLGRDRALAQALIMLVSSRLAMDLGVEHF